MKKMVLALAALFAATSLFAQTNLGVDYYYLGEYEKAQMNLETQLTAQPAESNFYLGEIAFAQGDPTAAASYYDKALAADPNYMPAQVGKIKLILKSNPEQAADQIKALQKLHKKDVAYPVALGRAYLDNGMTTEALAQVEAAKKIDKKYPQIYILSGDIQAASDNADVGVAAGEYEQAKYFDPDYMLAYMKLAQIYEKRNLKIAIDNMKAATERNPDYVIADAMMGRIYTTNGRYPEAIEALKRFFAKAPYSAEDIERMARAYYFVDADKIQSTDSLKFIEANKWVEEGLAKEPNHFVLNRYKMYLAEKMDDPTTALAKADNFFKTGGADAEYIPLDYITYGNILKNAGQFADAVAQYQKAIAIEPENMDTYTQVEEQAEAMKNYGLSAQFYQQYMAQKQATDADAYEAEKFSDINTLGIKYYQAGTQTTTAKNPELVNQLMTDGKLRQTLCDSIPNLNRDSLAMSPTYFAAGYDKYNLEKAAQCFQQMINLAPESYSGYVYMARTQNALYPAQAGVDCGKPKEYYSKTVDIIKGRTDTDPMSSQMQGALLEGLDYLGYYYLMTNDLDTATQYLQEVLTIDPTNGMGNSLMTALNNYKQQQQQRKQQQQQQQQ